MNKYQEALDTITETLINCGRTKDLPDETILKEQNELNLLKELVNKATPKKVIVKKSQLGYGIWRESRYCPNCQSNLTYKFGYRYCHKCGQALDWSGEDD